MPQQLQRHQDLGDQQELGIADSSRHTFLNTPQHPPLLRVRSSNLLSLNSLSSSKHNIHSSPSSNSHAHYNAPPLGFSTGACCSSVSHSLSAPSCRKMRNPGFVRIRRMQPRYKHKSHPSIRPGAIPTPRNILLLLSFLVIAAGWFHRVGFFSSSHLSSTSQHSTASSSSNYQHGAVDVDRVIWYPGDPDSNATQDSLVGASAHTARNRDPNQPTPSRPQIHVEALNLDQLPSQQKKPARASMKTLSDRASVQEDEREQNEQNEQKHANLDDQTSPGTVTEQTDDVTTDQDLQPHKPLHMETSENVERPQTPVAVQSKSLKEWLHFTPSTAINFMHFHKTGGVSFKTSLHKFYHRKIKKSGQRVEVRDACYTREGVKDDPSQPTFIMWRCDWEPLREMSEEQRNKHDFVFGHQFWGNGAGTLINKRDLRSFTILRHPFDRKVSFYYHFFVREVGRKEEDVTFEDIKSFLLYDKLTIEAELGRDLGPNYMAGRLLSDGSKGFVGNSSYAYFAVAQDDKPLVAEKAKKLIRDYVFVGLQKESNAAKCMLRKIVETFNDVNGISNEGVEQIDKNAARLNQGSYSLSAEVIWERFSEEEKVIFDRKERVDLMIYEEGERLFREHVKLFGCEDRILDTKYK